MYREYTSDKTFQPTNAVKTNNKIGPDLVHTIWKKYTTMKKLNLSYFSQWLICIFSVDIIMLIKLMFICTDEDSGF